MDWLRKHLPLLELLAGMAIVVMGMIFKPPTDTWMYLGFVTLALVPLAHIVVANMHAESLMRELARVKASDLDDLDKRIEKLRELAKQLKRTEDPPPPPMPRSPSLTDLVGKLVELLGQVEIAVTTSGAKRSSTGQPSAANSSSTGQPSAANSSSSGQPLTSKAP